MSLSRLLCEPFGHPMFGPGESNQIAIVVAAWNNGPFVQNLRFVHEIAAKICPTVRSNPDPGRKPKTAFRNSLRTLFPNGSKKRFEIGNLILGDRFRAIRSVPH